MVSDKVSQEKWFFYKLYITMAASLLVNQTFALPFNFFPCASAIDANADRLPRGYVIILANIQKQRGIIFHASYSRSCSTAVGVIFKSSSIRALVRVSPKLFPHLWMLSDRDERPHCQPHRTLPGQQILIRNAPGSPVYGGYSTFEKEI